MKNILWAAVVAFILVPSLPVGNSFAAFKSAPPQKKPAKAAAQKPPPCREGAIYNQLTCPSDRRTVYRRAICRRGRVVWENLINQADCPLPLNSCGEPEGEWQNGKNYYLSQNVSYEMTHGQPNTNFCFEFLGKSGIALDCRGLSISVMNPSHHQIRAMADGLRIRDSQNITVKNCHFVDADEMSLDIGGILLTGASNSQIIGNTFTSFPEKFIEMVGGSNNAIEGNRSDRGGIVFLPTNDGGVGNEIINNDACNLRSRFICSVDLEENQNVLSGHGNRFELVSRECHLPEGFYTQCPAPQPQ